MKELTVRVVESTLSASDERFVWQTPTADYKRLAVANAAVISSAVAKFYFKTVPTASPARPAKDGTVVGGLIEAALNLTMEGLKANFDADSGRVLALAIATFKVWSARHAEGRGEGVERSEWTERVDRGERKRVRDRGTKRQTEPERWRKKER